MLRNEFLGLFLIKCNLPMSSQIFYAFLKFSLVTLPLRSSAFDYLLEPYHNINKELEPEPFLLTSVEPESVFFNLWSQSRFIFVTGAGAVQNLAVSETLHPPLPPPTHDILNIPRNQKRPLIFNIHWKFRIKPKTRA